MSTAPDGDGRIQGTQLTTSAGAGHDGAATMPGVVMSVAVVGLDGTVVHEPSQAALHTTPPADNGGSGQAFSPTDLVGAALGACALTTMALYASRHRIPWGRSSARVVKTMTGAPRRIAQLSLEIQMPATVVSPEHRSVLEDVGRNCPVARSLHPDVVIPVVFAYPLADVSP